MTDKPAGAFTRVDGGDNPAQFMQLLDESQLLPHERMSREELDQEIYACMADLDDHELQVLSLKFGLLSDEPQSYRQMAPKLGRNREWIRKVGERALAKARESLKSMGSIPRRLVEHKRIQTERRLKEIKKSPQSLSLHNTVLIPWMESFLTVL